MTVPACLSRRTLVVLTVLVTSCTIASARADETPGLSATRPESGPVVEVDGRYMVPYAETIPGTDVAFEMIPVPGGEFLLGSPAGEANRSEDEGPQVTVKVAPFWIGKTEVTWAEYQSYMKMYNAFKRLQGLASNPADAQDAAGDRWQLIAKHGWNGQLEGELDVDAVTSPTPLYAPDSTYMAGDEPNQPAVTMTQYAARQYTKWLSGLTGREYRLPGEAEWEYAARAGSDTAFSWGDDPGEYEPYAWLMENSDYATHPVGAKEPNPWGLHDMHGNVAEWTLDQYAPDYYSSLASGVDAWSAINRPAEINPRTIRGGSWLDEAPAARSAARHKSEEDDWKLSDPNLPLSPWWYTEEPSMGVGMRLVRSLAPLSEDDKLRVWDADVEELKTAVAGRLKEGRGALGHTSPQLPEALKAAEELDD